MIERVIFRISIGLLTFWLLSPVALCVLGLEFSNSEFEESFEQIRYFGVPVCVFLALRRTFKPEDNNEERIVKVLLILGATIIAFIFMTMTLFADMCNWTNKELLYINKENQKIKIVSRDYGCGALDSEPPIVKNFKVEEWGKYFLLVKEINIDEIDKDKWKRT